MSFINSVHDVKAGYLCKCMWVSENIAINSYHSIEMKGQLVYKTS